VRNGHKVPTSVGVSHLSPKTATDLTADYGGSNFKIRVKDSGCQKTGSKGYSDAAGDVVGQVVGTREFAVVIEVDGHAFI
jgi:hypothetical protein